ncbi:ParB/RepB/Spo0J family partition protein [Corynebacterium frankenforstense]
MTKAQPNRRGGLGRGLAALIPTGAEKPHLSDAAADAVLGRSRPARDPRDPDPRDAEPRDPRDPDPRDAAAGSGDTAAENGTDKDNAAKGAKKSGKGEGKAKKKAAKDKAGKPGKAGNGRAPHAPHVTPGPATPGLDRLIAEAGDRDPAPTTRDVGATYQEIPVGEIYPNERQPRQVFDEDDLSELVHSIREFGLLQPIVVRPADHGFEIIMGERRWRAAGKAGLGRIPAIVRESDDSTMLRDALLENIHRVQLNPLEEGAAYQQLLEEFDVTQEELARRLGRSRPTVTNTIRLLSLPVPVQRKVAAGVLTAGHARALMGLKTGAEAQEALAERVVAEGLSVRATEEAVTLLNRGDQPKKRAARSQVEQPEAMTHAAERLADAFDTRVTVTMGKRKGKMVIEFGDEADFERIMALIEKR